MKNSIIIKNKSYQLPVYLPDGTLGVVRNLSSGDLKEIGIGGVVVNTYHLMSQPGTDNLIQLGGIKKMMNFDGLVTSDSGGWQVFSLIHRRDSKGKISDEGVIFSIGGAKNKLFSPELSIQTQFDINSDIVVCLDDFTPPDANKSKIKETVDRTILWAKRSKEHYERIIKQRDISDDQKPLLLAVIQGGWDMEERARCYEELEKIGFDAYGFGGYVIRNGRVDLDVAKFVVELIDKQKLKFALGFGRPFDIAALWDLGWEVFDCTLPTRDARHKRLYTFTGNPDQLTLEGLKDSASYEYLYLRRTHHQGDNSAISDYCDCSTCRNYSRGYLFHLFDIGDSLAFRLATIHNLSVYQKVIDRLRYIDNN